MLSKRGILPSKELHLNSEYIVCIKLSYVNYLVLCLCFLMGNPLATFTHGHVKWMLYGSNKRRGKYRPEQDFADEVSVGAHALQKRSRQQLGARGSLDAAGCRAVEEARRAVGRRAPHDYVEPRLLFDRRESAGKQHCYGDIPPYHQPRVP